ncbi:activator of 90 kDa heat shock protein ATPase homolog [Vigna radiata var. radiata]|uniref:Activator of 90 kDa heat shock protein ATPase homolog n=1 Tax=Vigna radiata var. radiata TaxID=3916 RepID=A0A1S3TNG6_VIGRR|nr:activator of 90 kDa heat shock protein ATPase homolog [Vigna radiata var. radiata]
MARYGEGDKRWIVEDRPDGTNVHNWHWAETNCLEWSRTFFSSLLSNLTILDGEGNLFIKTTSLRSLDGEAYINVRKGKIIPGYEISLTLNWHGEAKDSNGASLLQVDGAVEIPYISDENADEDPELRITVNDEGPVGKRIKDAMFSKGKPLILEKVRVWVQSMARGGPVKDELEKKPAPSPSPSPARPAPAPSPSPPTTAAPKKETSTSTKKKEKKGVKSISMTERFNCRAKDLYEILMDENRWKGFTQSNARISKEVGGEFSIFDGSVTGTNLELQEGKLIVQKWRFGSWNDGVQSTVRLVFEEPETGVTVVKLTHSDVPEEDRYGNATVAENTERGWRDLIFQRIRAVFGFGI